MESFVSSCSVKRIEVDSYSEHFQSNKQRSVWSCFICLKIHSVKVSGDTNGIVCCSTLFKL